MQIIATALLTAFLIALLKHFKTEFCISSVTEDTALETDTAKREEQQVNIIPDMDNNKAVSYVSLSEQLESIENEKERLQHIENLLTQLQICDAEHIKAFTISYIDDANNYNVVILADGENAVTKHLTAICKAESETLKRDIYKHLQQIKAV